MTRGYLCRSRTSDFGDDLPRLLRDAHRGALLLGVPKATENSPTRGSGERRARVVVGGRERHGAAPQRDEGHLGDRLLYEISILEKTVISDHFFMSSRDSCATVETVFRQLSLSLSLSTPRAGLVWDVGERRRRRWRRARAGTRAPLFFPRIFRNSRDA